MKNQISCKNNFFPKNCKAAMEMSVGTIVTIVLLMSVLVLGIFLVQKIFRSSTNAIDQIDSKIQNEIDVLFADEDTKLSVFPIEREIRMKQGESGGFGFSIKNLDMDAGTFSYEVSVEDIMEGCTITEAQAEKLIILGKSGQRTISSGGKLEQAILVKFQIPESAPICYIRYLLEVEKDNGPYDSTTVDLCIGKCKS